VTAKVLRDLRRLGNRETPTILSILVIEDLAMAFYLPVLSALVLGVLGLTMLVAGIAQEVNVSAAVGAFLVGIALSGRVAYNAQQLLSLLRDLFAAVFFVFFGLSTEPAGIPPVLLSAVILASPRSRPPTCC